MIQYLYQEGVESCSIEPLRVRKDGKEIGAIHKVKRGYRFISKDYRTKIYHDIDSVQKDIAIHFEKARGDKK